MKIGILTMYYQNYNYGGQLQAYALCKALSQQENEVEQISFDLYGEKFLDRWMGKFRRNYKNFFHPKELKKAIKVSKIYNKNREKYLNLFDNTNDITDKFNRFMISIPHTECVNFRTIKKISNNFDAVILGGDQIWNPLYSNSVYFGKWIGSRTKKLTYSVSGGKDIYNDIEKQVIIKNSDHIKNISVREKNLYQVLCNHYGNLKNIEQVVDPVFLLSSEQWSSISIDYSSSGKYIFSYLLNNDSLSRSSIKAYAKKRKLPIVTIPHARGVYNECDEGFGDVQVVDAGPREFIGLIKNAHIVFTDSFHGTCFCLIFQKQFYSIVNAVDNSERTTNERMRTILDLTETKDRLMKASEVESLGNVHAINYAYVDSLLESEIARSKAWLQEALKR